jgi:hypothetical protein
MVNRFDLGLEQVAARWERSHRKLWAPYIGIIGPRGCGKTEFLRELCAFRREEREAQEERAVVVDLRSIGVGSERELYSRLGEKVKKLTGVGESGGLGGSREPEMAFEAILRSLLGEHSGLVTLYLDSLECVPRAFARSLSRRFRCFWERRGEDIALQRLGLVFAGGLSVFELKQEADSAFPLSEIVNLGSRNCEKRAGIVRQRLEEVGWEGISAGLVNLLAEETGGEPAFIYPVVEGVSKRKKGIIVDEESVRRYCEDIEWLRTGVPIMQDLCIWYWNDERVRGVVERLTDDESYVKPSCLVADIDPIELSGVVVLKEIHGAKAYAFRNGMVERFFTKIMNPRCFRTGRTSGGDAHVEVKGSCLEKVGKLEELHRQATKAESSKELMVLLSEVWTTLSGAEGPRFAVAIIVAPRGAWVLQEGTWAWIGRETEEWKQTWNLLDLVLANGGSSVASSGKEVMFAIPIGRGSGRLVIVGMAMAGVWESALGNGAADHWRNWVRRIERVVLYVNMSEIGWALIFEEALGREVAWQGMGEKEVRKGVEEGRSGDASEGLLKEKLDGIAGQVRLASEMEIRKGMRTLAAVLIIGSIGGFLFGAQYAIDFSKARWEVVEPASLLVQGITTVVFGIGGILGLTLDRAKLHRRLVDSLVRRSVERRLRRAYLKELVDRNGEGEELGQKG